MKLIVEETIGNVVEVEKLTTILQIADFDVGLRQMLEAVQSNTTIATGNITLTDSSKVIQLINPNGADRTITLPAESMNNHGFLFFNTASTNLLVIKNDAGGAIGTVYPNGAGWFISNGVNWESAGLGTTDIATKRIAVWRVVGASSPISVKDGVDFFMVPAEINGYNLISAHAGIDVVSSSGTITVQLRNVTDSADMLSTRITIDVGELNSYTAATQPVIDTAHDDVATGDRIACDIDVTGKDAKGLIIILVFQLP